MIVANLAGIMRMTGSALLLSLAFNTSAGAQQVPSSDRSNSEASVASSPADCAIKVNVEALKEHPDEALLTFWGDGIAGLASGTVRLYAGEKQYQLTFVDVVAADIHNTKLLPTPIVIALAAATIDSAYVATLDQNVCEIHEPYVRENLRADHDKPSRQRRGKGAVTIASVYPDWSAVWTTLVTRANAMTPLRLGDGEASPSPSCAEPYVRAYTIKGVAPQWPAVSEHLSGIITIAVAIDARGKLRGTRLESTSNNSAYDDAAMTSAKNSIFGPEIYRCQPVSGDFRFLVEFQVQ